MDEKSKAIIRQMFLNGIKGDETAIDDLTELTSKLAEDLSKIPEARPLLLQCIKDCNGDIQAARVKYNTFVVQLVITEAFKK